MGVSQRLVVLHVVAAARPLHGPVTMAMGAALKLKQVVSNLVANACHHGASGTPVVVSVTECCAESVIVIAQWEPITRTSAATFPPMQWNIGSALIRGNGSGSNRWAGLWNVIRLDNPCEC